MSNKTNAAAQAIDFSIRINDLVRLPYNKDDYDALRAACDDTGRRAGAATTEVRVAGQTIASWRAVL